MMNHPSTLQIGRLALVIEHEDFVAGYEQGFAGCIAHRHAVSQISTTTLLWLIRNGFDGVTSATWTTGYILGWIISLYEDEPEGSSEASLPGTDRTACAREREE